MAGPSTEIGPDSSMPGTADGAGGEVRVEGVEPMTVDALSYLTAKADGGVEVCSRPVLQQSVRRDHFVSDEGACAGNVPVIGMASAGSVCFPPLILHH